MPNLPSPAAALPPQPFFTSPDQRIALARERFFERGERPTGLVGEAVIQSWTRCLAARRSPRRPVDFEPVTRGRLAATLERSRALREAAGAALGQLESALAGTGCRVLLTDPRGVIVHASAGNGRGGERVLRHAARVGVDLGESVVGTNAPAVVARTGEPVTVLGAEHFFEAVHPLHCAAAPVRDGRGRLAGVLDLTVEAQPFGFDAAALVGVYATLIENGLLRTAGGPALMLQFQVCPTLLDTPLEALAGLGEDGRVAWLNGIAERLLGSAGGRAADGEALFGLPLARLLALASARAPQPLALPSGLTVWLRVRPGFDEAGHADAPPPPETAAPDAPLPDPAPAPTGAAAERPSTLGEATREVIERTLAECGGNVSQAARRLGVSRGLLYRRLRAAPPRFP